MTRWKPGDRFRWKSAPDDVPCTVLYYGQSCVEYEYTYGDDYGRATKAVMHADQPWFDLNAVRVPDKYVDSWSFLDHSQLGQVRFDPDDGRGPK